MRKPTPKYANVTATLALFVALGGTSYAAATISSSDVQNGSLTGTGIRNESLKSRDVDNGSLTGSDLKNGSLLAADFKAGRLPAGPQGLPGPQGPQGVQGPQGIQGPAGATNVVTRRAKRLVANGGFENVQVDCQSGETVVGGGAGITAAFTTDAAISPTSRAKRTAPSRRTARWRPAGVPWA
jgi:hypothetical protein